MGEWKWLFIVSTSILMLEIVNGCKAGWYRSMSHWGKNVKNWKETTHLQKCCQLSGNNEYQNLSQENVLSFSLSTLSVFRQNPLPKTAFYIICSWLYSVIPADPCFKDVCTLADYEPQSECREMGDSDDQSSNYSCPDNSAIIPPALTKNAFCVTLICIWILIQEVELNVFFFLILCGFRCHMLTVIIASVRRRHSTYVKALWWW